MAAVLCGALMACNGSTTTAGAKYTISFPDQETLQFEAILLDHSNFELDGAIEVPPYGQLYFLPETPQQGFTWGLKMNLVAFLPETWRNLKETNKLPTGVFMPAWMKTAVIDVPFSNGWHAYFGVRGRKYAGAAFQFVDSKDMPGVSLNFNYRDDKGNVVVGITFFGPKLDSSGNNVIEKGGVFVGTDLSQFGAGAAGANKLSMDLANKAARGEPVVMNGKALRLDVEVVGDQKNEIRSERQLRKLLNRYTEMMRVSR